MQPIPLNFFTGFLAGTIFMILVMGYFYCLGIKAREVTLRD